MVSNGGVVRRVAGPTDQSGMSLSVGRESETGKHKKEGWKKLSRRERGENYHIINIYHICGCLCVCVCETEIEGWGSNHHKGKLWIRGVGKSPTGVPSQCDLH